jgi:hypothetical protein
MSIKQAVRYFGSRRQIAVALSSAGHSISSQAVYKWRRIPAERQRQIQDITDGRLVADV